MKKLNKQEAIDNLKSTIKLIMLIGHSEIFALTAVKCIDALQAKDETTATNDINEATATALRVLACKEPNNYDGAMKKDLPQCKIEIMKIVDESDMPDNHKKAAKDLIRTIKC